MEPIQSNAPPTQRGSTRLVVLVTAAAVAVAGLLGGVYVARADDGETDVVLEGAAAVTPDPFTPSVAIGEPQKISATAEPAAAGLGQGRRPLRRQYRPGGV